MPEGWRSGCSRGPGRAAEARPGLSEDVMRLLTVDDGGGDRLRPDPAGRPGAGGHADRIGTIRKQMAVDLDRGPPIRIRDNIR